MHLCSNLFSLWLSLRCYGSLSHRWLLYEHVAWLGKVAFYQARQASWRDPVVWWTIFSWKLLAYCKLFYFTFLNSCLVCLVYFSSFSPNSKHSKYSFFKCCVAFSQFFLGFGVCNARQIKRCWKTAWASSRKDRWFLQRMWFSAIPCLLNTCMQGCTWGGMGWCNTPQSLCRVHTVPETWKIGHFYESSGKTWNSQDISIIFIQVREKSEKTNYLIHILFPLTLCMVVCKVVVPGGQEKCFLLSVRE